MKKKSTPKVRAPEDMTLEEVFAELAILEPIVAMKIAEATRRWAGSDELTTKYEEMAAEQNELLNWF